jgi:hypothetical protein
MHRHGSFVESRTGVNVQNSPDSISSLLPALQQYQLSLTAPPPPQGELRPRRGHTRASGIQDVAFAWAMGAPDGLAHSVS